MEIEKKEQNKECKYRYIFRSYSSHWYVAFDVSLSGGGTENITFQILKYLLEDFRTLSWKRKQK